MKYPIPADIYKQINMHIPINCVDVCVVFNKKVLLIKRTEKPAQNEWWVIGGRVFKGEYQHETAMRKVIEETGLQPLPIHPEEIAHRDETMFPDGPQGIPVHTINTCFYATVRSDNVKLDDTSCDYKWVDSIDDSLDPYVKACLRNTFDVL